MKIKGRKAAFDGLKGMTVFEAIDKFRWDPAGSMIRSSEILIGETCNYRCVFCCADEMSPSGKWVPLRSIRKSLREARKKGAWLISFSGGEATLHPDFLTIVKESAAMGFTCIQLITNGLRIADPAFAAKSAAAGVNEYKFSLHGVDAATHDALTRVPGSFDNVLRAITNTKRLGVRAATNFAVVKPNYRQIPLYAKFVSENLDLTGFCLMFSFYAGNMVKNSGRLQVKYSEVMPYVRLALEYIRLNKVTVIARMLNNFLPCLGPELEHLMADWSSNWAGPDKYAGVTMDGRTREPEDIYSARKIKPASCTGCAYFRECLGVDKGYLELYGAGEFKPVKKKKSPFPIKPVYY